MLTGAQYIESLDDGRATYFEGERVHDMAAHEVLGPCVARSAADYDMLYREGEESGISGLMEVSKSGEDLKNQRQVIHDSGLLAHVTYTSIMTLTTAAGKLVDVSPDAADRIQAYVSDAQSRDIRITQCITDAKGDRSKSPGKQDDPDAYLRVVDRSRDGVVVRGAKLHITGASLGHELMTIPTKAMKPGEEDYAIAVMVPVNAPGVKIVNTTFAPRHPDTRIFPVSAHNHLPEGFVIFDDVFVPNERILLDGITAQAAVFAHSLGLWERLGGLSSMADDADRMVGLAQLIAEANGTAGVAHVKEKISGMMIHATLIRASLESALAHAHIGANGGAFPDELYINAGKYHGAANYSNIVRDLHDIAGGAVVTAPAISDFDHPDVGDLLRKYMSTGRGVNGEYRTRLFHTIRDLTADAYGGWRLNTNIQAGGGLYAQRIVTRRFYNLNGAKELALQSVGMTPDGELMESNGAGGH